MLFAQKNINSYKYILVPKQYEFQNSADQYQLNSLTKFLFKRAGFTVLFTDESFPVDLSNNRCLALIASVNNSSALLRTKMTIDLSDCYNTKIFSTKEGMSREKNYKSAYQDALRDAFTDLEDLKYAYDSNLAQNEKVIAKKKEIVDEMVVKEIEPMEVAKQIIEKDANETKKEAVKTYVIPKVNSIEGKYLVNKWGECNIFAKDGYYSFVGGDEKFEFAVIYKTSMPNLFIIKWAAFKQPRLLELDLQGNLKVEGENGEKIYKRVQ